MLEESGAEHQVCARCARPADAVSGRVVVVERGRGRHDMLWLCAACHEEAEKTAPRLKTWVPMAIVILVLGVGILVIEFIAVGIARLLTGAF